MVSLRLCQRRLVAKLKRCQEPHGCCGSQASLTHATIRLTRRDELCIRRHLAHKTTTRIPDPTWSIEDLQLTTNHPPVPKEELQRLSRLALIHVDVDSDEGKRLAQDLGNMMHMVEQVSKQIDSLSAQYENSNTDDEEEDILTRVDEIYDKVRGVTAAPLRRSHVDEKDKEEAANVWKSQLQPNTVKVGGSHEYFIITTKEEEEEKK